MVMSRRPGRIKTIVEVPVPRRERSLDTVSDPEYVRVTDRVLQLVREEV
jgi:ABC-type nitrate/sulfonate/bicarbonate transport system ATPase subunit